MNFISIFVLLHLVGAILGTFYVTWAELSYMFAAKDSTIDHRERKYLRKIYRGLHLGMMLVLVSAIGLVVAEYLVPNAPQAVLAAPFWASQTLAIIILFFGKLLSDKKIAWWYAAPSILVAWWLLMLIDFGTLNHFGYIAVMMAWLLLSFIVVGILGYVRIWLWKPKKVELSEGDSNPQEN
jgi:hypothetical protein